MATTAFTPAPCPPPSKVKKPPACPDCGALECLCRPRFFAGQLLSEQDLNRLDEYIKKKNRLHNLNLHGWGVVNGLKVLCDPCGQIKVGKGYAISPCGDDIVVCEDTPVDICALICKCRQNERGEVDCKPFSPPRNDGCDDLEEEWVLAIRYAEFPSRGITALRGGGCACGKPGGVCQCQGNGGCGCGPAPEGVRSKPRGAPAECEPTIVCEGYQFDVYRKTDPDKRPDNNDDNDIEFGGALADAFSCCVQGLFDAIALPPGQASPDSIAQNPVAWHQWCCRTRDGLIKYYSRNPGTHCELLRSLHTLVCPNPDTDGFGQSMSEVADRLGVIFLEGLLNCLCLALLPPAPEGTDDPRVPLATVKVRGKDCEIVSVCNWTVCRKMVTTWPAMCYWWSVVPIGQIIRNALDQICCGSLFFRNDLRGNDNPQSAPGLASVSRSNDSGLGRGEDFANNARINATHRLNPQFGLDAELGAVRTFVANTIARGEQPLEPAALLNSISRFKLATDQPALAKVEARNLPHLLLANTLARPLALAGLKQVGPERELFSSLFEGLGRFSDMQADDDKLTDRVAELEARLTEQQKVIERLQPAGANKQSAKKTAKKAATKKAGRKKSAGKKSGGKKASKKAGRK